MKTLARAIPLRCVPSERGPHAFARMRPLSPRTHLFWRLAVPAKKHHDDSAPKLWQRALMSPHSILRWSRLCAVPLALTLATACASAPEKTTPPAVAPAPSAQPPMDTATPDSAFGELAARFLQRYLATFPVRATEAGDHSHDGEWHDLSVEGDQAILKFVEDTRAELAKIPREGLSVQNAIDAKILESQLNWAVFSVSELREPENNPMVYTGLIGDGFDPLVSRNFAPVDERMKSVLGRLRGVPRLVEVAKKRLGKPPKIHTETAIAQNKGLIDLMKSELPSHFGEVPALKTDLDTAAKAAAVALEDFGTFLEKEVLPRSDGSFRLGRERFAKKLGFYLEDDVQVDALAKEARELLDKTQGEMLDTSKELWPLIMKGPFPKTDTAAQKKDVIRKVLAKVAEERPTDKTIVADAQKWLDEATKFVREKDLVRVPDEPCQVIEMPEYRRGVSVAYCDSSGPLEKKPETFYAIAPTPKDWSKERVASFYREYNASMLAELTIHEAMPGHFLQLMHNNRFKSDIRAVFGSGPFVEGWAVYTEWLMAKHGFGGPKVRLQRQKMVLRMCANAIIDHGIHAGTMEEKEALDLMRDEAFQEEGEAVGKWKRARLTSAQLTTYFYGFTEMMKLRAWAEAQPGFNERAYNDKVISFGSPAMRHIRTLMTGG